MDVPAHLQRSGGSASLEDEPPLADEHGALAEDVRVQLSVTARGDDLAFHVRQDQLQTVPVKTWGIFTVCFFYCRD